MDGGAWWATVHGAAKSRTRPSNFTYLKRKKQGRIIQMSGTLMEKTAYGTGKRVQMDVLKSKLTGSLVG